MKDINGAVVRDVNIRTAIKLLKEQRSELAQYGSIMKNVNAIDVSSNTEFQRAFNRFYKVRRNAEWRTAFYSVFEACKTVEPLTFEYILRTLYLKTGDIEASFSSKLLSALNPDMPIWDSIVLSKLNLKPSTSENRDRRLDNAVKIYQDIVRWYQEFLQTPEAQDFITAFDAAFPEFVSITAVKKVDFLLWGSGMKAGSHVEENKYLLYSHFGIKENDNGPEIIYKTAKKSYLDFCRRVYIPDHVPMERRSALEREAEDLLSAEIPALLKVSGQEAFDCKHQEICEAIIHLYADVGGLSYGIAQRWLNLTLMNLAVVESNLETGYWPIADIRKYFHVPVEQYLLEAATTERKNKFQHALNLKCAPLRHDNPDSYQMDWFIPGETQPFEYWGCAEYTEFQIAVRNKLKECTAYQDPIDWAFRAFLEVSQQKKR